MKHECEICGKFTIWKNYAEGYKIEKVKRVKGESTSTETETTNSDSSEPDKGCRIIEKVPYSVRKVHEQKGRNGWEQLPVNPSDRKNASKKRK